MDELVDKIILLDKEGQANIDALEKEKLGLSTYVKKLRTKLEKKSEQERIAKLAKIEQEVKDNYEVRFNAVLRDTNEKRHNISTFYEEQKDKWLKQLVEFCLKA